VARLRAFAGRRSAEAPALIGVVPAAGQATRLQPLPCSKELLQVGGRAVIDLLVERMRAGGAEEIRVVTRPDKHDLIGHVRAQGLSIALGEPANVSESVMLGLAGAAEEDIAFVGFPDTLWEPVDGFARLLPLLDAGADVALGLFRVDEPERCDVVVVDHDGRVVDIETKLPEPSSNLIWGCFAGRVRALAGLTDAPEPSVHFVRLAGKQLVASTHLSNRFSDIGTRAAMVAAEAQPPRSSPMSRQTSGRMYGPTSPS
jgi:glucose-1-phosphate thymidylyltransferase